MLHAKKKTPTAVKMDNIESQIQHLSIVTASHTATNQIGLECLNHCALSTLSIISPENVLETMALRNETQLRALKKNLQG